MGYALPLYGIYTHTWRFSDKEIALPHHAVETETIDGLVCAPWEKVTAAAKVGANL